MKRPQPDIGDILRISFINNVGSARKLKRLWGTTTVDGVEVLTLRQYYYPSAARSADFEKLFKFVGAYDQVTTGNYDAIESAWMYFNKNKGSDFVNSAIDADGFISDNMNTMWGTITGGGSGYTLTTAIVIEGLISDTGAVVDGTTTLLDPTWSSEVLAQAVIDNYDALWDTCVISQQGVGTVYKGFTINPTTQAVENIEEILSPEDPWVSAFARNALRSGGVPCYVKDVSLGIVSNEQGNLQYSYVVTVEIPYLDLGPTSGIVQDITTDVTRTYTSNNRTRVSYQNGYYTKQEITAADSSDLETPGDFDARAYLRWEDEAAETNAAFSSLWYNYNGAYYLRADAFSNPRSYGITYKQLYSYVVTLIDTGYKKKKAKWWQKLIAAIVFVIALIYALPTGGASLTLTQMASALVYASLTLTLFSAAFTALGMYEMASAFSEINKAIEPLVMIARVILVVSNILTAIENIKEVSVDQILADAVKDFVDELVTGITDITSGQFTQAAYSLIDRTIKLLTLPSQIKLKDLNDRNRDLNAEYEDLLKEASRETDLLMGFMYVYPKPATADWSMYAATFDYPYERGGGTLSLGNIQRTTKQAMRKGTYTDFAFDNILVV